jgi:hypothetical protein
MNTVVEIEIAIERLPEPQFTELAAWFEQFRLRRAVRPSVDHWLEHARGAARSGITLTRGEERSPRIRRQTP